MSTCFSFRNVTITACILHKYCLSFVACNTSIVYCCIVNGFSDIGPAWYIFVGNAQIVVKGFKGIVMNIDCLGQN